MTQQLREMDLGEAAKTTAIHNLRKGDLEVQLRRWWVKKYKIPWTHEAAQDQPPIDLLTEFYEDYFETNPKELRAYLEEQGNYSFDETGDALLDKWEQEFAQ